MEISPVASPGQPKSDNAARLRQLSQQLEANFLAEMLNQAGLGQTSSSFGGGVGEDQFASFLRQEQASAMVRAGGIGLAEQFFKAMTEGGDAKRG
ncbi:MAG: flagellar biosynthesis protein FlgJ [Cereibacter sphaeroides]|uniref:Flagellar biosynthesis protein FlgJ n=1 Tax=Cereibacter sphaeroides TaxID=1063 RepID=A0A2W5TPC5_CERSP|nr:MAG: flagellar biosynthesis protein FlgJ [Cereibacter sphaeroides]